MFETQQYTHDTPLKSMSKVRARENNRFLSADRNMVLFHHNFATTDYREARVASSPGSKGTPPGSQFTHDPPEALSASAIVS